MNIMSWNILKGGAKRTPGILERVRTLSPDVVVMSDFLTHCGEPLQDGLRDAGYQHLAHTEPAPRRPGLPLASKQPFERRLPSTRNADVAERWLEVWFGKKQFGLAAVYVPNKGEDISRKETFWKAIHEAAERQRSEPFLFMGDLNSGYAAVDAQGEGNLTSVEYFLGMPARGFTDAWRHKNRGALQYTWYSKRGGRDLNGFRLDHAFASASLLRRVRECHYAHEVRTSGLSDHSALLLSLR